MLLDAAIVGGGAYLLCGSPRCAVLWALGTVAVEFLTGFSLTGHLGGMLMSNHIVTTLPITNTTQANTGSALLAAATNTANT